jgi:hypothetical protein
MAKALCRWRHGRRRDKPRGDGICRRGLDHAAWSRCAKTAGNTPTAPPIPSSLFDLDADPQEVTNLADDPAHAATLERFRVMAAERWDLEVFDAAVRESQARRWVVYEALRNGAYYPWDFHPLRAASERFMRNHMDLNVLEENQRFPRGE